MFVIFKTVIKRIIIICRNFLWNGKVIYVRSFLIVWESMCKGKNEGEVGIKDYEKWN